MYQTTLINPEGEFFTLPHSSTVIPYGESSILVYLVDPKTLYEIGVSRLLKNSHKFIDWHCSKLGTIVLTLNLKIDKVTNEKILPVANCTGGLDIFISSKDD